MAKLLTVEHGRCEGGGDVERSVHAQPGPKWCWRSWQGGTIVAAVEARLSAADLITPNRDHVAVFVAEEIGGCRPGATLPAPFGSFSIVAADLNGDGAEVVVASYAGGDVAVLVGRDAPVVQRIEIAGSPSRLNHGLTPSTSATTGGARSSSPSTDAS